MPLCPADADSLAGGARLLSSYRTSLGTKVWIITEPDRSATTLLLVADSSNDFGQRFLQTHVVIQNAENS